MKRIVMLLIFSLTYTMPVFATMPVIDVASLARMAEMLKKANKQYSQLKNINKINGQQYKFLQKSLDGNFGFGFLYNDESNLQRRQWANNSWTDVLSASSSGHASSFATAQKKYAELYPVQDAESILTTRSEKNLQRTHYKQSHDISRAALAASSYSYDQINEHIKNIHDMLAMLENSTSEKAAIDLNTRLVAEVGFIQLEMLRQQNIQSQLMATRTQGEVNGMSDQSSFMKWH